MTKQNLCRTFYLGSLCLSILLTISSSQASTVNFSLHSIYLPGNFSSGGFITGNFDWNYTAGDFENGSGQFNALDIPGYGNDLSGLVITIELKSIEISLAGNFHDKNLDISLKLATELSPTQTSLLDYQQSSYELSATNKGRFSSGSIVPAAVPIPATAWLFGCAILGLFGCNKKNSQAG